MLQSTSIEFNLLIIHFSRLEIVFLTYDSETPYYSELSATAHRMSVLRECCKNLGDCTDAIKMLQDDPISVVNPYK